MIKKVILENWRTHAKSEFEFGKGTNVLVGSMGSGKTACMDSICFALFGTFPALQRKSLALEEIITSKPNKEDFAKIKVEFDYSGKDFAVERTIKRKGTNEARLYCNGKLVAGPKTTDVSKAIEQALDISYNLFSRAVYSEQNQIDFFLRLSPLQRKEQFDELLDLKRYEKARAVLVAISNRLKEQISGRKDWLEKQKKNFDEKEIEGLEKKISAKKKSNFEIIEKTANSMKEIKALQEKEGDLEKKEKESRKLRDALVFALAEAKEIRKNILETKKSLREKTRYEIEKEALHKEKEVEVLALELKKNDSETKKVQEKAEELVKEQGLNEEKTLQVEKALRELKNAKANCPVCRSALDEKTKKKLVEENSAEKETIEKSAKETMEKMKKIRELLEQKNLLKKEIEKKIEGKKEEILETKAMLKELGNLEKKESRLLELEKEAEKTKKQVEGLCFDEEELKKLQKSLVEKKLSIENLEREKESNLELIGQFQESLRKIEQTKKQLLELSQEIEKTEKTGEKAVILVNALKATQAELRTLLVENINIAMHDIWQKIYPYSDFSSARIEIEEGSYELKVLDRTGNWVRVEGILSGGERSSAALCIRIAFSLVLAQNLSWLILDEPTHNLDAQAVSVLSKIMREQLPELVEQIFVITHDREMEKAASASIYALHRDKNSDAATVPEQLGIIG